MSKNILVWDIPTRLCHWLLVASIFYAWFAIEFLEDMQHHFIAGYSCLTLILFRLIWGFVGNEHARFSSFIFTPSQIIDYSKTLRQKSSKEYLGHNPLGSLSVFLMLFIIGLQTTTGLFNSDDYFFGALNYMVDKEVERVFTFIHEWNFEVIVVIITVHIVAIVFYRVYKKQHLISAMIHGKKNSNESTQPPTAAVNTTSKLVLAAVILALCAGGVYLTATALPKPATSESYDYY